MHNWVHNKEQPGNKQEELIQMMKMITEMKRKKIISIMIIIKEEKTVIIERDRI